MNGCLEQIWFNIENTKGKTKTNYQQLIEQNCLSPHV